MEEEKSKRSNYGVKQECKKGLAPEKTPFRIQDKIYREKYKTNVLPAIKQTLKDGWLNDIALVPGHGPPIQTSSFLLASLSPWLRHLIQSAGEETCLCLPSVSSSELNRYLFAALDPELVVEDLSKVKEVHCLLAPSDWQPAAGEGLSGEKTFDKVRHGSCDLEVKTESAEVLLELKLNSEIGAHPGEERLGRDFDFNASENRRDKQKGSRGRPRKNYSEEAETNKKRKRGRPKKSLDNISLGEATANDLNADGELDEDYFHPPSDSDSYSDFEENGEKAGGEKRKKCGLVWSESIICSDCGETVKVKGRSKDGGKIFSRHRMKHRVEQFICECPGQSQLLPETEVLSREFVLKERHMKVEHMGWIGCDKCDKSFETGDKLEGHTRQKHAEIKSEGSVGEQKRKRRPNNSVRWPKDLLCPDCGENIGKGRSKDGGKYILRHQLKHQVENFVCECPDVPKLIIRPDQERVGKDFILKERHMKTVHLGWFGCTQCIQSFETEASLVEHREKHNLTFICDLCGFTAETKSSLKQHTVTKHVSNPVPCPDCGKHFANESLVKAHKKKVHTASPCPVCGVVIKNIRVHMEEMHIANSDKRFHCEDCGKGFMTKQRFESHRMNNHIKSQPHRCRYGCENSYNDRSNRNAHEKRRHGRLFTDVNNLNLSALTSE